MAHDALAMVRYGHEPVVVLLGDTPAACARARTAASEAGCRVSAAGEIADGAVWLDAQIGPDAVLVEVEDPKTDLAPLLDGIAAGVAAGRYAAVISTPLASVDAVSAYLFASNITHLVDADDEDRVEALRQATAPRETRVHDRREGAAVLSQLSEEVGRIANILASLSEDDAALSDPPGKRSAAQVDAEFVRSLIRTRRLRDQFFPAGIFADPAWDMLLDLMAARLDGERVAVSSLCIAAAVPATTALRWIKGMTEQGLFVRTADPEDGRRVHIELSDDAARAMTSFLRTVKRSGIPTV